MSILLSNFPWLLHIPFVGMRIKRGIFQACKNHDLLRLQSYLRAGVPTDVIVPSPTSGHERPLIFHVANQGFEAGLDELLARGGDPMATVRSWDNKNTRNHLLVELVLSGQAPNYAHMARQLVEAGACVDASKGWTADWSTTFILDDEPVDQCTMLSFREVILMKHDDQPEWLEVLALADGVMRARKTGAALDGVLPTPTVEAAAAARRF